MVKLGNLLRQLERREQRHHSGDFFGARLPNRVGKIGLYNGRVVVQNKRLDDHGAAFLEGDQRLSSGHGGGGGFIARETQPSDAAGAAVNATEREELEELYVQWKTALSAGRSLQFLNDRF